jgi:dolichol-phosphate mannosyltransferase
MISAIFSLAREFHVLIIDDGSPDGTAGIVETLQLENNRHRLYLIKRTAKMGLGTAYITGFKWALEHHYAYIFEMDADFSHNPDDLIRLQDACLNGADLAIGSRYKSGGKLAYGKSVDVIFCLEICAFYHGHEDP